MKYFVKIKTGTSIYNMIGGTRRHARREMTFVLIRYEGPMAVVEDGLALSQVDTRDESVTVIAVEN